jgi:hypothetical protein
MFLSIARIWWLVAQFVKQNISSYKFLPNRRKAMQQPAKISNSQNCTKRFPGIDTKHVQKYVEL